MANVKINGKAVEAGQGETILAVARREGFVIPTLCHHESVGSSGVCKMCVVEVQEGDKRRVVASCLYPAKEGMEITTDSDELREARKKAVEGFIAQAPSSGPMQALAVEYGVSLPAYDAQNTSKCIRCNLCVKTCKGVVGVAALEMTGKGEEKKVGPKGGPDSPENTCIACGACYVTCPTGHITMKDENGTRSIWGKEFTLASCPKCGRPQAPLFQLEWIAGKTGVPVANLMVCQDCK